MPTCEQILLPLQKNLPYMKPIIAFVLGILLLSACKKTEHTDQPETSHRTVVVYMSAENDLSNFATSDISEMIAGSVSLAEQDNLILFVDQASNTTKPYIARLSNGQMTIDTDYQPAEDFYSSDPEKFYEVLHWITQKYRADSYGLVLWGHADGWIIESSAIGIDADSKLRRAYGRDTGDNSESAIQGMWMNIPDMAVALKALGIHWKFIFCDCCNMQGAEVAYELRNTADYLIASPAEIPGKGAPYTPIVPQMFEDDTLFYDHIMDSYVSSVSNQLPISTVKLSNMELLAAATKKVLATINPSAEQDLSTDGIIYYFGAISKGLNVLHDMQHYIRTYATEEDFQAWKQALDQTVVSKRSAKQWMTANHVNFYSFTVTEEAYGGISMFVPQKVYDEKGQTWNSTFCQMEWYVATGWADYGW